MLSDVVDSELYRARKNAFTASQASQPAAIDEEEGGPQKTYLMTLLGCGDGFCPFEHQTYSVCPYAFACCELPPWLRSLSRCIWVAFILPGPKVSMLR